MFYEILIKMCKFKCIRNLATTILHCKLLENKWISLTTFATANWTALHTTDTSISKFHTHTGIKSYCLRMLIIHAVINTVYVTVQRITCYWLR